ncbi:hypothetical protein [Nocardioides alcanivorans]|uniref:hypothetical protein n=1 Tax=Nocardioides alcanivorans TaxID=2897352 RepID=UPI001F42C268|nr:hypothetical protein [Nocardioides alcanivorans]
MVARHQRDADDLAASWGADPGVEIIRADSSIDVPEGARIHVCALGPVQSGDRVEDPTVVERELQALGDLVTSGSSVVLVSSVLALAPTRERAHYAGWKNLVEDRLGRLTTARGARLSVLHPGRLVEPGQKFFRDFVHTPYPKMAALVEQTSNRGPHTRAVGLDARLWLLARGARVASSALVGSATQRDGGSEQP